MKIYGEEFAWASLEWSLVQILVTIAITQFQKLRIEVEKGFKWTMFELELVDPNVSIKFASVLPDGLVPLGV